MSDQPHNTRESADVRGMNDARERLMSIGDRLPAPPLLLLGISILIAPLLGLIISVEVALVVLVLALGFTTFLAWEFAKRAPEAKATALRKAAMLNWLLAMLALVLLVIRLTQ